MAQSHLQENQLQEINLDDNVLTRNKKSQTQVSQLKEFTKQVLSTKINDINLKQSLDYIKQKINFDSQKKEEQSYDGDSSFRNSIKCNFLDENESNYSSVSTVASINIEQSYSNKQSPCKQIQTAIVPKNSGKVSQIKEGSISSFLELWNQFKQIYMEEKVLKNQQTKESQVQMKQNNINQEEDDKYEFNIFSCLQCFKRRVLPKNLLLEKNIILYMYNTKKTQKQINNNNLLQRINKYYTQVNSRTNTILQNQQEKDNLNILSNLFLIAFADFHSQVFDHLLQIYENAPVVDNQPKVPIINVSCTFTNDIIYLLSTQRIDSQIIQTQSVITYVNNLYFALMFCYFQECVRNNNDFGEASSKPIITAILKQVNSKPESIISYFTKRLPTFIIDKNFLKYI